MPTPEGLLRRWVLHQAGSQASWLNKRLEELAIGKSESELHVFWASVPRRLEKSYLQLATADLRSADFAKAGWRPETWTVDCAARVLGLLIESSQRPFAERFSDLRLTADVSELTALYKGLPIYPAPRELAFEVGEGLRSNLKPVFEAIAHHSPYPRDNFDEHRWNHMILKALFVGSRLSPIMGLDERANPELALILREYAHERWAAGRSVSPEVWRCVGPFATDRLALEDLRRALLGQPLEAKAAALALTSSPIEEARTLLAGRQEAEAIASGRLTWSTLEDTDQ